MDTHNSLFYEKMLMLLCYQCYHHYPAILKVHNGSRSSDDEGFFLVIIIFSSLDPDTGGREGLPV